MLQTRLFIFLILVGLSGCYSTRSSGGGGQANDTRFRTIEPKDVLLAQGYSITKLADSLNFPSALCFDSSNHIYVIEAGYSYGEVFTAPKLLRLDNSSKHLVATGENNGPWTSVQYYEGNFYVSEGGQMKGGSILKISQQGKIDALVKDLPGYGDHHTNGLAIRNGFIYFAQGTATNSGIVGKDNLDYGWLARRPSFHDIPCQDVVLAGVNYKDDSSSTGAYSPYGKNTDSSMVIKGATPCSGAIMRVPLNGGQTEWVAWGFRNPYGLAFSPDGNLYTTENGYDVRGSRPVWGAGDVLWKVEQGFWYGWPDYSAGKPIWGDEEFSVSKANKVKKILAKDPGTPPKPVSILAVHSSSNGFDFSTTDQFGFKGNAFIAQFGDLAPAAGKVIKPVGFKIVRVDTLTGVVRDFAVNRGKKNGPASKLGQGGLERPLSVRFSPDGRDMFIIDFGIVRTNGKQIIPVPYTGVIWKVTRK